MDKNAIKKYAVWARRELIERVSQRALRFGITADGKADPTADSVNGYLLSATEKKQREALIKKVEEHGYEQVVEEVAYTWFNRFAALRFMEVNGYLPSHVRVFTDDAGEFKPQILTEAIHLELDGLDMDQVYALKDANDTEELYRYLLIVQCNALNTILPGMFQRIADYTELLLPENLLREGSVIQQMIELIPEEDWQEQVQIIGWLYQYYNTEPKDKVFADLKKNIKVTKEKIPAATQLFTPDWIVRYMVENSLGRLWLEGHPNDTLKSTWKYYLDEAEQEPEVAEKLAEIRKSYANMKPEEIKVIDPCMGSGHILCYMFDVLVQIYEDYGHTAREAVEGILTNNLYGLDIDDRAAQLAYFAVMMKGRQYDRRFFSRGIQPNVMAIQETNELERFEDVTGYPTTTDARKPLGMLERLMDVFEDAKEYGSLLKIPQGNYAKAAEFIEEGLHSDLNDDLFTSAWLHEMAEKVPLLVKQAEMLTQKYDVIVTNPPYMGGSNMSAALSKYVKKEYPDSKSDLSTAFMERTISICEDNGYMTMINIPVWMFLSSYEKLRQNILNNNSYSSMLHLGRGIFGSDFGTTSFVISKKQIKNYIGTYRRLFDKQGAVDSIEFKEKKFFEGQGLFCVKQENFKKVPGASLAYWLGEEGFNNFDKGISIDSISDFTGSQHKTADNERFLRYHWEIPAPQIKEKEWIFYIKGGDFRKWYGNIELVIDWREKALDFYKNNPTSNMIKEQYWFKEGITYTSLTSSTNGFRYLPPYGVFDIKGPSIISVEHLLYCLGFFNTKVAMMYLKLLNPTITLQVKDVKNVPLIIDEEKENEIESIVKTNIELSRKDWDYNETSWDFKTIPLILTKNDNKLGIESITSDFRNGSKKDIILSEIYSQWENESKNRFEILKKNEEELNRIFIEIYDLKKEITPEVDDNEVTICKAEKQNDIKNFISYAVGCMFGRYSLDVEGLAYAGGDWDASKYKTFLPDTDAIIPICDDEYFEDDIVGRFVQFVEVVYGKETLEENLQFIADALGGKGTSREVIRNYFVSSFYADHVKTYKKRPIYWLFDSGKKNGFKCLIYMHRYQPDTLARIRTDYIHEQQSRYRTVIDSLEQQIASAGSSSERVKLTKLLNTRQAQAKEIREYEEKVHHLADQMIEIDLDDGVKHNYAIFKDVLAKIK